MNVPADRPRPAADAAASDEPAEATTADPAAAPTQDPATAAPTAEPDTADPAVAPADPATAAPTAEPATAAGEAESVAVAGQPEPPAAAREAETAAAAEEAEPAAAARGDAPVAASDAEPDTADPADSPADPADSPRPAGRGTPDVADSGPAGMSHVMPDAPTLLAGRYRLGDELGRGGMGQVWLAHDEILEREVAVKRIDLPEELAQGDAAARRSLREARAAARLSHPNVVQVYDILALDERTWIVMEYVPSRSLREVIAEDGPLDPYRVARIGVDLLAALQAAHRAGVQHRDVKPGNVLLADDGRVLLTDFGIAAIDDDSLTSKSDVLVGSPLYMAPERARFGAGGAPADMWGLGATLYAAVEGHPPFQRTSTMATLAALATEEPDPPAHAGPLAPVLDGLLRKDPAQRMAAEEAERLLRLAVAELDGVVAGAAAVPKPRTPADDESAPPAPAVPERRLRLIALAAAVVVLLAAGLAVFLVTRPSSETTAGKTPATTGPAAGPAGTAPGTTATSASPSPARSSAPPSSPAPPASASAKPSGGSGTDAGGRPVLPAGWRVWNDETGFSVYVPKGWRTSTRGTIRYFRDGKGHVLGIDQTDKPKSNPVADWKAQKRARVSAGDFPRYDEIKIAAVDYFQKAADWEFTFTSDGVRQHVNNRGVVTSARQAYGFWFQSPDAEWARYRAEVLQVVFDSFVPDRD
ncbi:hypothetical protein Ate01nite_47940 [Actinoplanes teichomyceticus]|nr:hypothetical protein Ate01nite_47940 [Actinoplanes teichomyceticus]